jgi:hypothetical protein
MNAIQILTAVVVFSLRFAAGEPFKTAAEVVGTVPVPTIIAQHMETVVV